MRDLLSEGMIIDCRVGKSDSHNDQKYPEEYLYLEFYVEHEAAIAAVLPAMRFYPEVDNRCVRLLPHARGYLLGHKTIAGDTMLVMSVSCASWPDIAAVAPGFTLTDSRAQVRKGELYVVLPMVGARRPPRAYHRTGVLPHHRASPVQGQAVRGLYTAIKGQPLAPLKP